MLKGDDFKMKNIHFSMGSTNAMTFMINNISKNHNDIAMKI